MAKVTGPQSGGGRIGGQSPHQAQIRFHAGERLTGHGERREVIREDGACEQDLQGQVGFGGEKRDSILARPHYWSKGTESRQAGTVQRNGQKSQAYNQLT